MPSANATLQWLLTYSFQSRLLFLISYCSSGSRVVENNQVVGRVSRSKASLPPMELSAFLLVTVLHPSAVCTPRESFCNALPRQPQQEIKAENSLKFFSCWPESHHALGLPPIYPLPNIKQRYHLFGAFAKTYCACGPQVWSCDLRHPKRWH